MRKIVAFVLVLSTLLLVSSCSLACSKHADLYDELYMTSAAYEQYSDSQHIMETEYVMKCGACGELTYLSGGRIRQNHTFEIYMLPSWHETCVHCDYTRYY